MMIDTLLTEEKNLKKKTKWLTTNFFIIILLLFKYLLACRNFGVISQFFIDMLKQGTLKKKNKWYL